MEKLLATPVAETITKVIESTSLAKSVGLFGAVIISGGIGLDLLSQHMLWEKGSTEITSAEDDEATTDHRRWLALPGLGRQSGHFIGEQTKGLLPGVFDYANYASRGISSKAVGTALAAYYDRHYSADSNLMRQNVIVHSMGLPTFLMGVEWCINHGITVPPVETLLAFSSPLHAKHTFMEERIRLMTRIPYPGGALSKLGVEFYQRFEREKFRLSALGHSALGALKVSYRECPPALWSSQVRTIAHRNSYHPNQFADVITPETAIFHYGDMQDRTVDIGSARSGLLDFAASYGTRLNVVDVPGDGHANIAGPRTLQHLRSLFVRSRVE